MFIFSNFFDNIFFFKQQEIDVCSILAVDYQSKKNQKNVGMPAFNSKSELVMCISVRIFDLFLLKIIIKVGFYKYVDGGRVLYLPVEDDTIELCGEDKTFLHIAATGNGEGTLCQMTKTDDYIKDLDRLKEDALKALWMSTA